MSKVGGPPSLVSKYSTAITSDSHKKASLYILAIMLLITTAEQMHLCFQVSSGDSCLHLSSSDGREMSGSSLGHIVSKVISFSVSHKLT